MPSRAERRGFLPTSVCLCSSWKFLVAFPLEPGHAAAPRPTRMDQNTSTLPGGDPWSGMMEIAGVASPSSSSQNCWLWLGYLSRCSRTRVLNRSLACRTRFSWYFFEMGPLALRLAAVGLAAPGFH